MRKNKREFKDAIYEQLARIGKAAASPKRLELLDLLGQGPRSVEALAEETGQSVANVSQHLQVLRAARLVDAKKEGLYVNLARPPATPAGMTLLRCSLCAEHSAEEVETILGMFERAGKAVGII